MLYETALYYCQHARGRGPATEDSREGDSGPQRDGDDGNHNPKLESTTSELNKRVHGHSLDDDADNYDDRMHSCRVLARRAPATVI